MLSSNDKKLEKMDPFYRPSVSKQKTSAEIISEARNALRTVRTQRPFTPQEDQRKLFGPASSRTPENRPPSSFSLHASSFESPDCKPISGTRLSPLELKPKAPPSPSAEEDPCLSFPKPPVDPAKIRRISSARARLFRAASQGALLPDRTLPPAELKKTVESKDTVITGDSTVKTNGIYLTESDAIGRLKSHPLHLTYDGGFREIRGEQEVMRGASSPSHLRSGGDHGKRRASASSCPSSSDLSRLNTKAVSKADLQEKDTEMGADEVFWNTRIAPVLHELEKEENIETVCATCTELYHALEEGNMLGNKFKRRSVLLKTLYKLVDVGSDLLSLKLAKIILALKVSRKNLLNVCKLIFKISRSEKNDCLLQNENILESLLEVLRREVLQDNTEAFLYCVGTLKFISGNPRFLNEIISKGTLEILTHLIRQMNDNFRKCGACLPDSGHLLVQITATLRNLVNSPQARSQCLGARTLPQLCLVMELYMDDKDACTNIVRILSKLTSYHDCCTALASYSRCYALFLSLINKYQKKQDLVVRTVFILGNLTAKNNQARERFSREKASIGTLLSLFQIYQQPGLPSPGPQQPTAGLRLPPEAEDVLVKVTRVLANIAIHPRVGSALAADRHVVGLLLTTLESKSLDDCEELVINTTAAINNLSFYQVKNSIIQDRKLYIAELLLKLLVSKNMDGILEAVRVFGNLSQDHDICDFIVQKNVHKFMIALLDAKHQDLCFSACGVLLNLTVDKDKRIVLKEGGGIKKLMDCLRDFGPTDWQLACLVCKTLWNFSENTSSASSCFGDEDTNTLLVLLSSFLNEELALDSSFDPDLKSYHRLQWETEFKPVALQLLNRIQSRYALLEPLPVPSS
ncbi:armadillo repeat-containing protein 2 [Cavia porcellus]|uniref:Armadillo repeat containing 2 n=1 Tax=Cavia porcellus TaxID=10141 RepID=H0V7X9_CAVPO|nr:armadillo repeat-containing protein 2 [Cavia porcellus]XP_023419224.1 armadillo repeat-containing protein 2 [Cavia porcellus]